MTSLVVLARELHHHHQLYQLIDLALSGVNSQHTKRAYKRAITRYIQSLGKEPCISRESVQAFIGTLLSANAGNVTVNQSLSAVKLFIRECNERKLVDDQTLASIERIKGKHIQNAKLGNWLDIPDIRQLLDTASRSKHPARDKALIACMVGCAMRREEVVNLTWDQWQMRNGRYVWVDVVGKGNKTRSIPAPHWVADAVEAWRIETVQGENENRAVEQ